MSLDVLLRKVIAGDCVRMRVLALVRDLGLPDCWVAAGFVRSGVWDFLHGREFSPLPGDIDVIWYDCDDPCEAHDRALESVLRRLDGELNWSVKNQARMHARNADASYHSSTDAMKHWPETATAVGIRLNVEGRIEVAAPFGLEDLFSLVVRPGPRFLGDKHDIYLKRLAARQWHLAWPRLTCVQPRNNAL
jgi:hypothetical protein